MNAKFVDYQKNNSYSEDKAKDEDHAKEIASTCKMLLCCNCKRTSHLALNCSNANSINENNEIKLEAQRVPLIKIGQLFIP